MKPELIKIEFADGSSNAISVYEASELRSPVVIILPAMGVRATFYEKFAHHFTPMAFHVVTVDHRGHGQSSVRPSKKVNFGYKEIVEMEFAGILGATEKRFPDQSIFILGHSLGGQIGCLCAARYSDRISGVILSASCSPYHKGWDGILDTGLVIFSYVAVNIARLLGFWPGHIVGFGGKEGKRLFEDWFVTATTGKYVAQGSDTDYEQLMSETIMPVLAISYEGDSLAPPASVKNLATKFNSSEMIALVHVDEYNDIKERYDHYTWAKKPELAAELMAKWIWSRDGKQESAQI